MEVKTILNNNNEIYKCWLKKPVCRNMCSRALFTLLSLQWGVTVHITHGFNHGLRVMVSVRFGICYVQGGKDYCQIRIKKIKKK